MAAVSDGLSEAMTFKALQPFDGHGFADRLAPRRRAATDSTQAQDALTGDTR